MKRIQVLGTGCRSCHATTHLIEERARALGAEVELEKVEEIADIVGYGVMSTPAVVVDGQVVHAGGVPGRDAVDRWLA